MAKQTVPRIEALRVKNYRVLQDVELREITPLSVLLGPNGSGKSTLFDVFAFLAECFTVGLRPAWDKRGRFQEMQTRGSDGPIEFELKYREIPKTPLITYHLTLMKKQRDRMLKSNGCNGDGVAEGSLFASLILREAKGTLPPVKYRLRQTNESMNNLTIVQCSLLIHLGSWRVIPV